MVVLKDLKLEAYDAALLGVIVGFAVYGGVPGFLPIMGWSRNTKVAELFTKVQFYMWTAFEEIGLSGRFIYSLAMFRMF